MNKARQSGFFKSAPRPRRSLPGHIVLDDRRWRQLAPLLAAGVVALCPDEDASWRSSTTLLDTCSLALALALLANSSFRHRHRRCRARAGPRDHQSTHRNRPGPHPYVRRRRIAERSLSRQVSPAQQAYRDTLCSFQQHICVRLQSKLTMRRAEGMQQLCPWLKRFS